LPAAHRSRGRAARVRAARGTPRQRDRRLPPAGAVRRRRLRRADPTAEIWRRRCRRPPAALRRPKPRPHHRSTATRIHDAASVSRSFAHGGAKLEDVLGAFQAGESLEFVARVGAGQATGRLATRSASSSRSTASRPTSTPRRRPLRRHPRRALYVSLAELRDRLAAAASAPDAD
jgi:hypothetical protein